MKRLQVTILDLVTKGPTRAFIARLMNANLASIMPQVVAAWCEELGHEVPTSATPASRICARNFASETDMLFVGAFSRAAQTAYAISNLYRQTRRGHRSRRPPRPLLSRGRARVLRLRARLHRQDDDRRVLRERAPHRPLGRWVSAARQPTELPGVRRAGSSSSRRSPRRRPSRSCR